MWADKNSLLGVDICLKWCNAFRSRPLTDAQAPAACDLWQILVISFRVGGGWDKGGEAGASPSAISQYSNH